MKAAWLALTVALAVALQPAVSWTQDPDREALEREMFGAPDDDNEPGDAEKADPSGNEGEEDESQRELTDEERREREMFGATDDDEPDVEEQDKSRLGTESDDREGELFGGDSTTTISLEDRLGAELLDEEDKLALGGFLFARLDASALRNQTPNEWALAGPQLLDVYLDGRPNDRVRAYVRGRLVHNLTFNDDIEVPEGFPQPEQDTVDLDQLWLKFDIARIVYVTAGRQPIRWGVGRFWTPTDFLNRDRRDPLDVFDNRLGVDAVKLHLPIESLGWNAYAVASFDDADRTDRVGGAFRVEMLFGVTEAALTTFVRKDSPFRLGADVSTAVWDLDLRAEASVRKGDRDIYWEGSFDPQRFQVPTQVSRRDEWLAEALGGVEWTIAYGDDDFFIVGAEYYFNQAGYEDEDLLPWLFLTQSVQPFYIGQHYASAFVLLPSPGTWDDTTFTLSGIGNLSDQTTIVRFDYSVVVLTHLSLNTYVSGHAGNRGGEFRFGYELEPLDGIEGLENGLVIEPPIAEAGVGLRLSF